VPRAGRLWEARRSGSDGSNDVQDLSTVGHVVVVGSPYHMYPPPKWRRPRRLVKRKDKEKNKEKREKQCKMSSKKCVEYGEQKNNKKEPETGEPKMKARDLI